MGRPRTQHAAPVVRSVGPYSVRISDASDDPEWDDFLETAQGSAYQQTSGWGRVQASIGWRPVRAVVSEDGQIVAGVQILTRALPAGGSVGRVTSGPILPENRPDLAELVLNEMMSVGRASSVRYLVANPPQGGDWMCNELTRRGFRPSAFQPESTATICIDLQPDLDGLLAKMTRKRRQNIRAAERRGVTVRRGSEADLPVFNHLKSAHAARIGYTPREEGYYTELWRALAPRRHIELFIAEYEGGPVSALLVIPFGDMCYHMERPWSGEHGDLKPNELLDWQAIRYAKSEGYRFTDLGGIRPDARATSSDGPAPSQLTGWESFKLGYGGELILLPESYDYVYSPFLRFAYRSIPRKWLPSLQTFVDWARVRAWGRRET
jgi:peptidoglycan pentaglycine glycine transferase (the first glycine)